MQHKLGYLQNTRFTGKAIHCTGRGDLWAFVNDDLGFDRDYQFALAADADCYDFVIVEMVDGEIISQDHFDYYHGAETHFNDALTISQMRMVAAFLEVEPELIRESLKYDLDTLYGAEDHYDREFNYHITPLAFMVY